YINDSNLDTLASNLTNVLSEDLVNYILAYRMYGPTSSSSSGGSSGGGSSGGGSSGGGGTGGTPTSGNPGGSPTAPQVTTNIMQIATPQGNAVVATVSISSQQS